MIAELSRSLIADTTSIRFPLVHSDHSILVARRTHCPKAILCGRRLKTCVGQFVRAATATDFGPVSSLCRSARYTIFGWHCEGIRDRSESTDQSVLQKHTYVAQHVTCQKHTFLHRKSTTGKLPTFRKLMIFGFIL